MWKYTRYEIKYGLMKLEWLENMKNFAGKVFTFVVVVAFVVLYPRNA